EPIATRQEVHSARDEEWLAMPASGQGRQAVPAPGVTVDEVKGSGGFGQGQSRTQIISRDRQGGDPFGLGLLIEQTTRPASNDGSNSTFLQTGSQQQRLAFAATPGFFVV